MTEEEKRIEEAGRRDAHWRRWGPYLSERQWGTVREDYSAGGAAWDDFTHDQARSRAYRWGEDGIGGICDRRGFICFALALWNGRDPILKERLFGVAGGEGNHGEDVKEYYFYLDATPTSSYLKFLYKYPQREFPYGQLVEESRRRAREQPEFELIDTGIFDDDRYFDVFVEYAKASADDILIRVTACNRGPETAEIHLLPTVWFRNTWSWEPGSYRPGLRRTAGGNDAEVIELDHEYYGRRWLIAHGAPRLLFTENETNFERVFHAGNRTPFVKDGIHDYVVSGTAGAINPAGTGTKAAAYYRCSIPAGGRATFRLRLTDRRRAGFGRAFDRVFDKRKREADLFFAGRAGNCHDPDTCNVQRQAFAGMLWSRQFYHYYVRRWLEGDPAGPAPPAERLNGRNREWLHLYNADVISMPDKWEYPWYAAWDLAFHSIPLAQVDPEFAKQQLVLLLREWYMHPNGQLPAYEWALGDVNPPVHAWAAWRVYKIEKRVRGRADRAFLERVFHKLLLNFTWWVNRKDAEGKNVFQGGFLGLDNIGVFDRSAPLPTGGHIEQSDGTSWMAMYCLNMLAIALELARENAAYEDVANKFFEHFVYIAHAMDELCGGDGRGLWDDGDGFFYDVLHLPGGERRKLKVRSMVGLIPLFAVEVLEPDMIRGLPGFRSRMQWFLDHHPQLAEHVESRDDPNGGTRRLLSIVGGDKLVRVLGRMLDEDEFLSDCGIRALSRIHGERPYRLTFNGQEHRVGYEPGESSTGSFGGNSNWRGPVWFPVNFLLIESLQKFHHFYGDSLKAECPAGSGRFCSLWEVSVELSRRLIRIFLRDAAGRRPVYGARAKFQTDPHWRDYLLFHEYFHGETGEGLGASHQTGWTGLVAKLIEQSGE